MGKRTWPKQCICVVCGEPFELEKRPGGLPITCSPECQRRRRNEKHAEWRANTECPPEAHGTITGYVTYACSCDECRKAERLYMREYRRKKNGGPSPPEETTYEAERLQKEQET